MTGPSLTQVDVVSATFLTGSDGHQNVSRSDNWTSSTVSPAQRTGRNDCQGDYSKFGHTGQEPGLNTEKYIEVREITVSLDTQDRNLGSIQRNI